MNRKIFPPGTRVKYRGVSGYRAVRYNEDACGDGCCRTYTLIGPDSKTCEVWSILVDIDTNKVKNSPDLD